MKKTLMLFAGILFATATFAQDCNYFIPQNVGKKVECSYYNSKDKLDSRTITEVISNEVIENKRRIIVETESFDKKDVSTSKNRFNYYCYDGKFEVDMKSMLDQSSMSEYSDMSIEYKVENYTYPNELSPGMKLNDGYVEAIISNEGFKVLTLRIDIKDITVEAVESITVPAGTFEAYRISSTVISKTGFVNVEMTFKEWVVKDLGAVRRENYNKNGKLIGYSVITKIF